MVTERIRGAVRPSFRRDDRTTQCFGAAISAQLALQQLADATAAELDAVPDEARRWLAQTFDPRGSITDVAERERLIAHRAVELRRAAVQRAKAGLTAARAAVERAKEDAQHVSSRHASTVAGAIAALPAAEIAKAQLLASTVLTGPVALQAEFRQRVRRGERDAVMAGVLLPEIGDLADAAQAARAEFGRGVLAATKGEAARFEARDVGLATDMVTRQADAVAALVEELVVADGQPMDPRDMTAGDLMARGNAAHRFAEAYKAGLTDLPAPRVHVPLAPEQARERENLSAPELLAIGGQDGAA